MALDARPKIVAFRGVTNGDGRHDDLLDAVSRIRDLSLDPPVIKDERVY